MSYQSNHTVSEIDTSVDTTQQILNLIYPIGAVYISVNDVSPANFIGGTWERIQDRFLVAAGDSYEAGTTGGTVSHAHTTGEHTLTIDEMPSHKHGVGYYASVGNYVPQDSLNFRSFRYKSNIYTPAINGGLTDMKPSGYTYENFIETTGGGASHSHGDTSFSSNLPPYLSVYMWKRTA